MKLVVTHEQPDFDALASVALAKLAHPGSVGSLGGDMPDNVRAFVHLYRDELQLVPPDEVDLQEVSELIVVDTNDPRRLGRFEGLLESIPVTLYDHHPRHDEEIKAAHGIQEQIGSTAALLTRHLEASAVEIPPQLASLALLGIHEDTGNLSFDLTTAEDYQAAAHLMGRGASLEVVREFQSDYVDREQRELLQAALDSAERVQVGGFEVVVSAFDYPRYVRHAAGTCNMLLSRHGADAAILAVAMEGKTLVFARALRGFDVGEALTAGLDGGGHQGAAFARVDLPPGEAARKVLDRLSRHVKPALTARQIMSSPVKSIAASSTVGEALELLSQYGHNGAPVLGEDGALTGVVSRRDLERALRHEMAQAKVSGFMTREVVTARPDATLMELERLVEERNIGRIPIVEGPRLIGIVTRSDLLAAHHPPRAPETAEKVCRRLPGEAMRVIEHAALHLERSRSPAALYLVGGTVRDALLGRALLDLDLAVEGYGAESLITHMQRDLGGRMTFHAAFGTSTLTLDSGLVVDVAGAREEYYPHPGALPQVTPASIRKDLSRRDFTVNALAVRVHPAPATLIDPHGGASDLRKRLLRPLHPLSFIEDPTRILRGARLAGRMGFDFANSAVAQAGRALEPEVLSRVSRSRLRGELELTLAESRVRPVLGVLEDLEAVEVVFGLTFEEKLTGRLDELRAKGEVPDLAYLLGLLLGSSERQAQSHVEEFHWPRRMLASRERLAAAEAAGTVSDEWLEAADEAELALLKTLSPALAARVRTFEEVPRRRKVRGRDVLELGLPAGPQVGEILAELALARERGQVESYEDELELARRRVAERLGERVRE